MALDKLIKLLSPLSDAYGTGNTNVDLLIIFAGLCIVSMFAVILFLLSSKNMGGNSTVTIVTASGKEVSGGASELKIYVDDLSREIQIMLDSIRGDTGYIRQEMYLVKRLLEDTKRAVRKQQLKNGSFDIPDLTIDTRPINDTSELYSYKETA